MTEFSISAYFSLTITNFLLPFIITAVFSYMHIFLCLYGTVWPI